MAAAAVPGLSRFFGQPVKGPPPPPPPQVDGPIEAPRIKAKRARKGAGATASPAKALRPVGTPPTKKRRTVASPAKGKAAPTGTAVPAAGGPTTTPSKGKKKAGSAALRAAAKRKVVRSKAKVPQRGKTAAWGKLYHSGVKAPASAYSMWNAQNRARIQAIIGVTDFAAVSKAVGEAWKALTDEERAPFRRRREGELAKYVEARDAYKDYAKNHDNKLQGKRAAGGKLQVRAARRGQSFSKMLKSKPAPAALPAAEEEEAGEDCEDAAEMLGPPSPEPAELAEMPAAAEVGTSEPAAPDGGAVAELTAEAAQAKEPETAEGAEKPVALEVGASESPAQVGAAAELTAEAIQAKEPETAEGAEKPVAPEVGTSEPAAQDAVVPAGVLTEVARAEELEAAERAEQPSSADVQMEDAGVVAETDLGRTAEEGQQFDLQVEGEGGRPGPADDTGAHTGAADVEMGESSNAQAGELDVHIGESLENVENARGSDLLEEGAGRAEPSDDAETVETKQDEAASEKEAACGLEVAQPPMTMAAMSASDVHVERVGAAETLEPLQAPEEQYGPAETGELRQAVAEQVGAMQAGEPLLQADGEKVGLAEVVEALKAPEEECETVLQGEGQVAGLPVPTEGSTTCRGEACVEEAMDLETPAQSDTPEKPVQLAAETQIATVPEVTVQAEASGASESSGGTDVVEAERSTPAEGQVEAVVSEEQGEAEGLFTEIFTAVESSPAAMGGA